MIYIKQAPEVISTGTYHDFLYKHWNKNDKVLIIGCGRGTQSKLFLNAINLDIDRDILMYCMAAGVSNLVQADASHIPFKQRFDKILMADIIEHFPPGIEYTHNVINEVNRVSNDFAQVSVIMPLKDMLNLPKSVFNRITHKSAPIWSLAGHTNPLTKLEIIRIFHDHFCIEDDSTHPAQAIGINLPNFLGGQYIYMVFRKV